MSAVSQIESKKLHSQATTTEESIFTSSTSDGDNTLLLAVAPGAKASDALNLASCFLGSAEAISAEFGDKYDGANGMGIYGINYLVRIAKALVDSTLVDIEHG